MGTSGIVLMYGGVAIVSTRKRAGEEITSEERAKSWNDVYAWGEVSNGHESTSGRVTTLKQSVAWTQKREDLVIFRLSCLEETKRARCAEQRRARK